MNNNMSAAIKAKNDKTLNTKVRYEEGIMTRLEWLRMQYIKGATVNEGTKNRLQYNRTKFNRMTSVKEQDEYMAKCNEKVICYELHLPNERAFWEITKTEYDRFKLFELEEDIASQKMELTHKIEAGTATDQEIEEDEQNDFEFFRKYAN